MKLTSGQIRGLLKRREDERVEFKRAASELPDYFLDYRERLSNETRWNDRVAAHDATWSGNIYDFFFKIHDRVTGDVKIPFKIAADGITRIDDTPVHKALREVLANALIHADYHGRRGIVVEKHFRTITFSNPGTMRVSKSVAVAGGTSDARNSAIFNIFALVDIGERSGMGLANLHGLWKKYGYSEPKITESYDPDRTVLVVTTDDDTVNDTVTRPENGAEPDQNPTRTRPEVPQKCPNGAPEVPQKCPKSAPKVPQKETADLQGLTAAVRQVYKAMCEDISMTHRGLESKLGLSKTTIRKATATLVQKGFIRRVGPKKGGHWEVMP